MFTRDDAPRQFSSGVVTDHAVVAPEENPDLYGRAAARCPSCVLDNS